MPDEEKLKRRSERRNKNLPPKMKDANTGNMVKGLKAQSVFLQSKAETAPPTKTNREDLLRRTSLTPDQIHCLKDIPLRTIRRAWFTSSHLLLEPGSIVAIMGCSDSAFPYAMAIMNPTFHIIGIDPSKELIANARETWKQENLEFVISKLARTSFPESLFDAIVDSFALQDIFQGQSPQDGQVQEVLNHHLSLLKKGGALFLREYTTPPPNEYVLMEMPDTRVDGKVPEGVRSEPELLLRFSEEANADEGQSRGFFLEELAPINPGTRLFRLMYKWAYEFILLKDNKEAWEEGKPLNELTFMTPREFRKTLRHIGSRVVYTAPIWDSATVRENYIGHFKLYDDDGQPLGFPPTSHVFVARKVGDGQSLRLEERRPSKEPSTRLHIQSMRNSITGEIRDLISRDIETVEFLPYRITDAGRLHIYLHDGIPRAITNAVPRSGKTLDDKRWAGHMVEAISVDREVLSAYSTVWTKDSTEEFALKELSLRPVKDTVMEKGPEFFPNPQFIDERIETFFLHTTKSTKTLTPKWVNLISKSFSDSGVIREFDAQQVLNAISVGFIPNSRLEMLIMALFNKLGIKAESWAQSPIHLHETDVPTPSFEEFMSQLRDPEPVFENSEEAAGDIRTLHSYFVDTGYEDGHVKGLAAHDIEFIVKDGETINTAVVIPLMKNMNGDVLAGYIRDYLPVPQRFGGSAKSIRAPSYNLPPEIKDMEAAKAFIGREFDVSADKVMQLGQSYLLHNAITPQRIYPFAVLPEAHGSTGPGGTFTEYAPIRWLWRIVWHLYEDSEAVLLKEAIERMHHDIDFGLDRSVTFDLGQGAQESMSEYLPISSAAPLNTGTPFKTPDVIEAHQNPEKLLERIHNEQNTTAIIDEPELPEQEEATTNETLINMPKSGDTPDGNVFSSVNLDQPRPDKH
jgi:precorrin-6B methylase 2